MIYDMEGLTELSFFSEDLGGIRAKCRPDWISNDKNIVIDLKTTQDASPKGFQKSIAILATTFKLHGICESLKSRL